VSHEIAQASDRQTKRLPSGSEGGRLGLFTGPVGVYEGACDMAEGEQLALRL
jgi:hypothetical protein